MNANDLNMDAVAQAILQVLTRENKKCKCTDTCTCKKENFEGQNIKITTDCQPTTYDPAKDEMWETPQSSEHEMRWIIRLFKAWYRADEEKVELLLKDINDEEIETIRTFANMVLAHTPIKEDENNLMDAVTWKVKSILTTRKAKYDWVTYNNLRNLVCTDIDIDAQDPRVDNAVAQDFFVSAATKLYNGEEIEIDMVDFKALNQYLAEAFNSYSLSYDNGKVTAKF